MLTTQRLYFNSSMRAHFLKLLTHTVCDIHSMAAVAISLFLLGQSSLKRDKLELNLRENDFNVFAFVNIGLFNLQRMIRFVQRRLAGSTVGVDGKGKKWQVMVSVLCNRRPLIVDDFGATAGQIKHVNMDLQVSQIFCS